MSMNKKFRFGIPLEVTEKGDQWIIEGLATTPEKDLQGEVVDQDGLDFSQIEKGMGLFNWNHKNDPQNLLGKIDSYKREKGGTKVRGYLFKHQDNAKAVYNILRSLKPEDQKRMQMSIEGSIKERGGAGDKIIKQAVVEKVALTMDAVNPNTYCELVKSLSGQANIDLEKGLVRSEQEQVLCETERFEAVDEPIVKAEEAPKVEAVAKGVGAEAIEKDAVKDGIGSQLTEEVKKSDSEEYITLRKDKVEQLIAKAEQLSKMLSAGYGYEGAPGDLGGGGAITTESVEDHLSTITWDDKDLKAMAMKKKKLEENEKLLKPAMKSMQVDKDLYKSIIFKMKKLHPSASIESCAKMADNVVEMAIEKAYGHKYIRREGTPGFYRYYYADPTAGKGLSEADTANGGMPAASGSGGDEGGRDELIAKIEGEIKKIQNDIKKEKKRMSELPHDAHQRKADIETDIKTLEGWVKTLGAKKKQLKEQYDKKGIQMSEDEKSELEARHKDDIESSKKQKEERVEEAVSSLTTRELENIAQQADKDPEKMSTGELKKLAYNYLYDLSDDEFKSWLK